jgi:hypothetical protein
MSVDLAGIVDEVTHGLAPIFEAMEQAEHAIVKAQARHGEPQPERDTTGRIVSATGPLWRSFTLLRVTHPRMSTPFVYQSHCQEILDRVAAGEDTRPGTDAEIALVLMETSLGSPLKGPYVGLYMRVFTRAFPDEARRAFDETTELEHYEAIHGTAMDEAERELRRKLIQDWRTLPAAAEPQLSLFGGA